MEMYRILNKERGRAYFSVEFSRSVSDSTEDDYFLVHEIPTAMAVLGKYFFLDFKLIPPDRTLRAIEMDSGTSVIQSYVLKAQEPAA